MDATGLRLCLDPERSGTIVGGLGAVWGGSVEGMTDPKGNWSSIIWRPLVVASVGVLAGAIIVGLWAVLAQQPTPGPVAATPTSETPTPRSSPTRLTAPSRSPSPTLTAAPTPIPTPGIASLLGTDGRLTILLMGSDYRRGHPGNRTDTMMIISVDPTSDAVAAASIPRDTVEFPLPDGTKFRPKINALYETYRSRIGDDKAGAAMARAIGRALRVEIDNYIVIGFEGVERLVDAVGGVDVVLAKPVRDPQYWLSPTRHGISFPAGANHLNGERALIFARTRKGDNDFERARRQQKLIVAAVAAVRKVGILQLPELLTIVRDYVKTDLPLIQAENIFRIAASAKTKEAVGTVFGPRKWAQSTGGSFALKIDVVRKWTARYMAPVE